MRIVVDFQGAQTNSRFRGIGRYSTEFVKALVKAAEGDEVILALNGAFSQSIESIRAELHGIMPQWNIRVWYAPEPVGDYANGNAALRELARVMREFFLRSLEPDIILVCSLFEGLDDPAVSTVNEYIRDIPTASIFYDLIQLDMPDDGFRSNPEARSWLRERIAQLRKCDLLLAISESSRDEVIRLLEYPPEQVANIFGGLGREFVKRDYREEDRAALLERYDITKPFLLYVGGLEPSKNLSALIEGLSFLPPVLRSHYQLVIGGKRSPSDIDQIQGYAGDAEIAGMLNILGYVPQSDLVALYNLCELFVFPSLREGLGMPPAEAMACGAPTIVSNCTSLPEVVRNEEALFDPKDPRSIARKIETVLTDQKLREGLVARGLSRTAEMRWERTAQVALDAIKSRFGKRWPLDPTRRAVIKHTRQFAPRKLRIIVQKLDHNGDFLLALPAFSKLRARYPDARIDVLVGSWNRAAAEACGLFDKIYTLDYFKALSSHRASLDDSELSTLIQQMSYYDYAIDLRRTKETRFILLRIPAGKYFGYKIPGGEFEGLLTNPLEIHPDDGGARSFFDETHICEQMLRLIDVLPFDINDYVQLPKFGARQPKRPRSVAIFPRVGLDARQWETSKFGELIDRLANHSDVASITLYSGRAEELEIIGYEPNDKISIQAGLNFAALYASVSAHEVCVGNNSFGVHLAGYAGCRAIGLYSGHEIPEQWGPPFGDSIAITVDAPCAPCHLPDRESCPFDVLCLGDISVDLVEKLVLDTLNGRSVPEDYSRITCRNPASAIKPLLDMINNSKFKGRLDDLTEDERVQLAAAMSVNFPERVSNTPNIYIDVSGLLWKNEEALATRREFEEVHALLESIAGKGRRYAAGILMAAGPRDREFYAVELNSLEETLFAEQVNDSNLIIRPLAGDVYIGLHSYPRRPSELWNLLATWRQNGVQIGLRTPAKPDLLFDRSGGLENCESKYLAHIAQFDMIFAPERQCGALAKWIEEHGPARLRPLQVVSESVLFNGDWEALWQVLWGAYDCSARMSRDEEQANTSAMLAGDYAR